MGTGIFVWRQIRATECLNRRLDGGVGGIDAHPTQVTGASCSFDSLVFVRVSIWSGLERCEPILQLVVGSRDMSEGSRLTEWTENACAFAPRRRRLLPARTRFSTRVWAADRGHESSSGELDGEANLERESEKGEIVHKKPTHCRRSFRANTWSGN